MLFDVEIPEWARWITQDADGEWWCFERLPATYGFSWWNAKSGCADRIAWTKPPADWTQELYEIEWK